MRIIQIVLFFFSIVSFLATLFFLGQVIGDILWRTGVAALLVDLVCIKLWPNKPQA